MGYVIMTGSGKEELVVHLLSERGIKSKVSFSIKGAVISNNPPPSDIRDSPLVIKVYDVSDEALKNTKPENKREKSREKEHGEPVKAGDMGRVLAGRYKGFCGIVAKVEQDRALMHLGVYGKILPVETKLEALEKIGLSKLWR